MPQSTPQHKGTGVLPVVMALKVSPRARQLVPRKLAHYLSEQLLPSAWYPEQDYYGLLRALAASVEPDTVGGNVWTYFGRVAAQRDLAGNQTTLPMSVRVESAGLYRSFAKSGARDPAAAFNHAKTLWRVYHDTGELTVWRDSKHESHLIMRVTDFDFGFSEILLMQQAYCLEYFRVIGIEATGDVRRSAIKRDGFAEWNYYLSANAHTMESIRNIPIGPPP